MNRPKASPTNGDKLQLEFPENALAQALYGPHNSHLTTIEKTQPVTLHARGNQLTIAGPGKAVELVGAVLESLYDRLLRGLPVDKGEVEGALRIADQGSRTNGDSRATLEGDYGIVVRTKKKHISPRSANQADYLRRIDTHDLVFAAGPAGSGKTYLAVAKAVERLNEKRVERIILSRPAVEAGEQLGFLPGDMREKVDPYLRPLYDALYDMMPEGQVTEDLEKGRIEVAPLAFMRGRTLANAFVILDEAQNTTAVQMKMLLTRLGENSCMVITGDLSQVDLPRGTRSGLRDALETLDGVDGVAVVTLQAEDVVRHPLVRRIVDAYDSVERERNMSAPYETAPEPATRRGRRHG